MYTTTYKNLHPSGKSFAVSSPDGTKRHMAAGAPPRSLSPSLPGLSSMLQLQRSDDAFTLSPRSPNAPKLLNNTVFKSSRELQARQAAASAVARALAPPASKSSSSCSSSASASTSTCSKPATVEKSSRYLREIDRRAILSRIQQGEKQSALAKEYQVSRAAICNLNKHRDEVLSRKDGNPLAKHPKKPRPKTMKAKVGKAGWAAALALREAGSPAVHEIKSRAAALLLTTLRKKHASVSEFRRASDRLMRLVMEEALAFVPVKTVEIFLPNHSKSDGVALEHPPCAVSMEPAGCPMLDLFHLMEPEQPSGYVSFGDVALSPSDAQSEDVQAKICGSRLPGNLNYHNVFVMDHVITSAEVVVAVVRRLQERGAVEAMISLVALIATPEAVEKIHAAFPTLKIVIAQVDNGGDELASPGPIDSGVRASTTDMILDRLEQVYHGFTPANAY
ncbi:hypothetical protein PF008_g19286 [Phytophthora fragariae]|uniref:Phosphoribosyltransferase domain-containing protein n=1 Tax=Phytophthora fragariae TaxID=53985 RepID=A0A6G0R3L3_9STRA|nr:hypothetical protein PF008_g19286 [Phytophthora fragariae]